MATIEGAAITWQLTKSDRKRTYNRQTEMKSCCAGNWQETVKLAEDALCQKSAYQVNSFVIQVVF